MSTEIQDHAQADGPRAPSACELVCAIARAMAKDEVIRALSINGQTGVVTVEYYREGLLLKREFRP